MYACVCASLCMCVCLSACMQVWMYVKVSVMNIYIWTLEFGPVHENLISAYNFYAQKSAFLKFVRGYGIWWCVCVLVCMWGAWFEVVCMVLWRTYSRSRDCGLESYRRHCVVTLRNTLYPLLSTGSKTTQEEPFGHD